MTRMAKMYSKNRLGAALLLPSFAESHGCKPVDECEVGTFRSLGEGGCASEGSALGSVWRGATAVRPWGSTSPFLAQVARALQDGGCRPPGSQRAAGATKGVIRISPQRHRDRRVRSILIIENSFLRVLRASAVSSLLDR